MIPHFRGLKTFLGALYPSKSGLMNKHIVKHTYAGSQHPWVHALKAVNQTNKLDYLSCHCPVLLGCVGVVLLEQVWESKSMAMAEAHQGGKQREGWGLDADIVEQALSHVSTQQ